MADRKNEGSTNHHDRNETFRKRLDGSSLLRAMDGIYKKEYGVSAKKYFLTGVPRPQAERMLSTLEGAPHSITKTFKR